MATPASATGFLSPAANGSIEHAPSVVVEVLVFRLDGDGWLDYREVRERLRSPAEPDALALSIAGIDHVAPEWTVSHSTSWRCDPTGVVMLTYAVAPDPDPLQVAEALQPAGVLSSGDPLRPSPGAPHVHHVAAHAVRHLAHLAAFDPTVREAASHRPDLWRAITQAGGAMAVGAHEGI